MTLVPGIHVFAIDNKLETWMAGTSVMTGSTEGRSGVSGHHRWGGVSRMPAYWIARSKINEPVAYKRYTDQVPDIIAKFGGKVLARGGRYEIMEGPEKFQRFVIIEFPTFEQGVACFRSPEYVAAAAHRRGGAGEVETVMLEAGEFTR